MFRISRTSSQAVVTHARLHIHRRLHLRHYTFMTFHMYIYIDITTYPYTTSAFVCVFPRFVDCVRQTRHGDSDVLSSLALCVSLLVGNISFFLFSFTCIPKNFKITDHVSLSIHLLVSEFSLLVCFFSVVVSVLPHVSVLLCLCFPSSSHSCRIQCVCGRLLLLTCIQGW